MGDGDSWWDAFCAVIIPLVMGMILLLIMKSCGLIENVGGMLAGVAIESPSNVKETGNNDAHNRSETGDPIGPKGMAWTKTRSSPGDSGGGPQCHFAFPGTLILL